MDIICTTCGEPWDMDVLHEIKDEQGVSYETARVMFTRDGCKAVGTSHNSDSGDYAKGDGKLVTELYELLGDDVDGAAAMLEDFGLS